MDDEVRRMLRQNLELARENNKLLRSMRRSAIVGRILYLMWIAILIGVPVYVYLTFLQPYFEQLGEVYTGVRETTEQLQQLPLNVQNFLDKVFGFPGGEGE